MASWRRAIAWAVLSLGVIGCAEYAVVRLESSLAALRQATLWVTHTYQVIDRTERIAYEVKDAESSLRAYVITGDPTVLGPLDSARRDTPKEIRSLEDFVSDKFEQRQRFEELGTLIAARLNFLSQNEEIRRTKGLNGALSAFPGNPGRAQMRNVLEKVNEIRRVELELLDQRTESVNVSRAESVRTGTFALLVLAAWLLAALVVALEFGRAQRRLGHFIDSVNDGFIALDFRWHVTHINRAAQAFYGVTPKDIVGKDLLEVLPKTRGSELERKYRDSLENRVANVFRALSPTTGKTLEVRCFPTREGIVVYFLDVTERVMQQRQIEELNETLEQRVAERTAQLEGFCYSIAHDMRTHIRGVSINASMVQADLKSGDPISEQNVSRLVLASKQMARLADDLLEHARSSSIEVRKERVDLSAIAEEVAENVMRSGAYDPATEFVISPGLEANADPQLIRVVLQNLIDNACKYCCRERTCSIEFGRSEEAFFVRDNGIGFDEKYVDRMFMPFERLHSDARIPGSGIGLANVKRIVERHRGRVWATSTLGEGSTFYFTLGS